MTTTEQPTFTREQFMIYNVVITESTNLATATEDVSQWATYHPEVDLCEQMTWAEWEAQEA